MTFALGSGITDERRRPRSSAIPDEWSRRRSRSGTVSESQISPESAETTALAAAIRAGDEEVFERLATGHRRELLVHCYRMLGSLDEAEDAVQEALLRAWRYRGSLQAGAPLRPWLYRVATNVCLDAIARDERRSALAGKSAEGGA